MISFRHKECKMLAVEVISTLGSRMLQGSQDHCAAERGDPASGMLPQAQSP